MATPHVFCNLIEPHDFTLHTQVDNAIDTRPFHVDVKGWGSQTMCSAELYLVKRYFSYAAVDSACSVRYFNAHL